MDGDSFSWEVVLPERTSMGIGGARPCATLCLHVGTELEELAVPGRVGRALQREQAQGNIGAANRRELLATLRATSTKVAKGMVVQMATRRDHSEHEVRAKLRREGFSQQVCNEVLAFAVSCGLVSNRRFAEGFVRAKVAAGWGVSRIERELSARGVDAQALPDWPHAYLDPDDEFERALAVASHKRVREPNAYGKLMRFLMGRGFTYGVASKAAKRALEVGKVGG